MVNHDFTKAKQKRFEAKLDAILRNQEALASVVLHLEDFKYPSESQQFLQEIKDRNAAADRVGR